jgi:hypothetical protein
VRQQRLELWDTKRLEEESGIRSNYWEKLRHAGGGPDYCKIGRRCFYEPTAVQDWLAAHRRKSTSDPGPDRSKGVQSQDQQISAKS